MLVWNYINTLQITSVEPKNDLKEDIKEKASNEKSKNDYKDLPKVSSHFLSHKFKADVLTLSRRDFDESGYDKMRNDTPREISREFEIFDEELTMEMLNDDFNEGIVVEKCCDTKKDDNSKNKRQDRRIDELKKSPVEDNSHLALERIFLIQPLERAVRQVNVSMS